MIIGIPDTNHVYLSPHLGKPEGLVSPRDVQRALYHLSDNLFRRYSVDPTTKNPYEIIKEIHRFIDNYTIQGKPEERAKRSTQLRHAGDLIQDNIWYVANALREVANDPGVCKALSKSSAICRELGESVKDISIDVSDVKVQAQQWMSTIAQPVTPSSRTHVLSDNLDLLLRMVGPNPSLRQGGGALLKLLGLKTPLTAEEMQAAGGLMAFSDQPQVRSFIEHVFTGPITTRDFDRYFMGEPPRTAAGREEASSDKAFFDAFRFSSSPIAEPFYSHKAIATLIVDFLHIGALAAASTKTKYAGRSVYEKILGVGTLSMFQHQRYNCVFLNTPLMTRIRAMVEEGATTIPVGNHRSHLDPVFLYNVHPASFVYKKELGSAPVLGTNPFIHPLDKALWQGDSLLRALPHIEIDRNGGDAGYQAVQEQGEAIMRKTGRPVAWMSEGTRIETPDGDEEVGALRNRSGAYNYAFYINAAVDPRNTWVVAYAIYGTGQILPTNLKQVFRRGVRQNQTVVIAPCGIFRVSDYKSAHDLEMAVVAKQSAVLGEIQAAANNGLLISAA